MSCDMTKPTKWVCAQRRLRSDWASAQSDQSLRCALIGWLRAQSFFMRTAKTLIRLGACPGWSESSLGTHSLCWFCHVEAQIYFGYFSRNLSGFANFVCHCRWATSWENLFLPYANNKGADQPAHPRSLISAFVICCLDSIIPLVSISKIYSV